MAHSKPTAVLLLGLLVVLHAGGALARTNKPSVKAGIEAQWDRNVIWGSEIDHAAYLRGIAAIVGDFICEGACGFTGRYLTDLVERQIESFTSAGQWASVGRNFIDQLVRNPGTVKSIVAGTAHVTATVKIASYNHWTEECRFCMPCPLCSPRFNCNDCGTYRVPRPNTHQPYFAFKVRPAGGSGGGRYTFSLRNNCHKAVYIAVRYLPRGGSWTSVCWYTVQPRSRIIPSLANARLTTSNRIWYYYAESTDGSLTWSGSAVTRSCRGRSLGMRESQRVSNGQLTLVISCAGRQLRPEANHSYDGDEDELTSAEVPNEELCKLAEEDGLEGTPHEDPAAMNFTDGVDEFVDANLCGGAGGDGKLEFSEVGASVGMLDFKSADGAKSAPPANTEEPVCDKACTAVEQAYQELAAKLKAIHARH